MVIDKEIVKDVLKLPGVTECIQNSYYDLLFSKKGPLVNIDPYKITNLAKSLYMTVGNKMLKGVKRIPELLFFNFDELESIDIPEGVVYIGKQAFVDCKNLRHVKLPESLKNINEAAFSNCAIESIIIPKNVERISDQAFSRCNNLIEIKFEVIPSKYFGTRVFPLAADIREKTKVYIPKDNNLCKGAYAKLVKEELKSLYGDNLIEY